MTYRVIVWATGAIGKTCLRAVLQRPDLELVGLFVYSERKEGVDAGTIARLAETGVLATRSREEILAIDADLVIHTARLQVPYETHDDDIIALLRSGKNVITTAGNHYPQAHGAERARLFLALGWGLLALALLSGGAFLLSNDPFRFIAAPALSLMSLGIVSPITLILFLNSRKHLRHSQASSSQATRNLRTLTAWSIAGIAVSAILILIGGIAVVRVIAGTTAGV